MILFFASSCDQLVEKPTDFVGPDNFFTTPAQIESAFTASMDVLFGGWTFYDWYGYPEIFEMDDQVYGGDLVIGDDFGSGCWQKHFRAISFINPAIKALNAGQVTGISQEKAD